jgi:hypothetical protein
MLSFLRSVFTNARAREQGHASRRDTPRKSVCTVCTPNVHMERTRANAHRAESRICSDNRTLSEHPRTSAQYRQAGGHWFESSTAHTKALQNAAFCFRTRQQQLTRGKDCFLSGG